MSSLATGLRHPPLATQADPGRPAGADGMRLDTWIVAAATVATFAIACAFELHERVFEWSRRFEVLQLDELPLALTTLVLGLAWVTVRRHREALAALAAQVRAEHDALRLLEHNRDLAQRLIQLQESERAALARELHDELAQRCTAIRFEAECLQHMDDLRAVREAATRTAVSAQALHDDVRQLLRRLRPAELDELGLVAALQALGEAWEERCGIACIVHHDRHALRHTEGEAITVYRVVQEALANVVRHACASRVRILLARGGPGGALRATVEDDGCGFDTGRATRGLGLIGASERAALHGGGFEVDSAPGRGTRVTLVLPEAAP